MKKLLSFILCLIIIFSFAACGGTDEEKVYEGTGKSSEIQNVDLSVMNKEMATAEFTRITKKPDEYIGKKIKMCGTYTILYNDNDETQTYSSCSITDATGCCPIGALEFVLKDGVQYPKEDEQIVVEGLLEYYYEGENRFIRLSDAQLFDYNQK